MNILNNPDELVVPQDRKLDVLIVSPGGNACGFLKQVLTNAGLLVGLTHKVVPDIDRVANSIIYLHNDPLLSLVCKMRKGMAFKSTLMRQTKKLFPEKLSIIVQDVLKKHEKEMRVFISSKGEVEIKPFNQKQERDFVKDLLYATLAYQIDYCNMSQLFDDLYKMRDDLNILFLDFRDPNLNAKLFEFLNVKVDIKFLARKSNKNPIRAMFPNKSSAVIQFYQELDQTIIDKIKGAQLTSGLTMVNPFNKPNIFQK